MTKSISHMPRRNLIAASLLSLSFISSVSNASLGIRPFVALIPGSSSSAAASTSSIGTEIGQLVNVTGDVKVRLPRQVRFKKAKDPSAFFAQAMLATHGAKSEASLVLDSGAVIHILGNSRLVAEFDPNHEGALFMTILNGELELKKEATKSKLHFVRGGREIELKVGQVASLVPVIGRSAKHEVSGAPSVVATTADEARAAAHAPPTAESSATASSATTTTTKPEAKSEANSEAKPAAPSTSTSQDKGTRLTLNNDDITKQVKSQMSFFQRCYLNFLGRSTGAAGAASGSNTGATGATAGVNGKTTTPPPGSGPNGGQVVVLGFTIQNTGRVNQTHVVRSDIQDVTLQKCLTEVLERTSFRSFAGDDIEVSEYPILLQ